MMELKFRQKIEACTQELKVMDKSYGKIANIRLAVLILGIFTTYKWIGEPKNWLWMGMSIALYIVFIYFIKKHQGIKLQMDYYEAIKKVNEKYLMRLGNEWHQFDDDGSDLLDQDHPYAFDLDIIGNRSLFQKINATHTWYGRKKLGKALLQADYNEEELTQRQKAIGELLHDLDFCQKVEGIKSSKIGTNPEKLIAYATTKNTLFSSKWWKMWSVVMTWVTLLTLGVAFLFKNEIVSVMATIFITANIGLQLLYFAQISVAKGVMGSLVYDLNAYRQLLEVIDDKTFSSDYLKGCAHTLFGQEHHALKAIKKLESISNKASISYQPIVAIPLNALWLWDMKVMLEMEEWKSMYGSELDAYLQGIGEVESLVSLSILGHVEEQITFPLVEEQGSVIEGTALGHPLIEKATRVCNDVKLDKSIFVITGSNMSGKTTFLRTLGIHLVLAYAGAPVFAERMRCSRMALYTSMRIRDDLSQGISTFYAELTRIKMIVEAGRANKQMCFLIDEIFRGTNSGDRIMGAKSVVKGLQACGAIGGITTHDLEICQLGEGESILNYHFTERYTEDNIEFDYILKEGPSTTTNARYLMKMVGIDLIE